MLLAGRFSLRTYLFLLLAFVAVLACTKQVVSILGERTRTLEAAQADLHDRAIRSAEREEHLVDDVAFVLGGVAREPFEIDPASPACQAELARLAADLPWLANIGLVSPDGGFLCSSLPLSEVSTNIGDRDYFREAVARGDFVLSDFLISRRTGLPIVAAAVPRIVDGLVHDVVVAGIDLSELGLAVADAADVANATTVVLLDRNGLVVTAAPADGLFAAGDAVASTELGAVTTGASGVLPSLALGGHTYIVAYADLPSTGGRLVVLRDRAAVLADTNARTIRSFTAMVLVGFAICLLVWLGGERFVLRPLEALRTAARKVASGELARVDVGGFVPEFRQLGEQFNAMSKALAERNAELSAANLRLAELALRDALTDLGNRRAFEERIEVEGARCARERKTLSLLLIDVDNFKQFNDRYGHFEGDDALRRVAAIVASGARRASDFAARIGGEEFALILPDCAQSDALTLAQNLVTAVAALRIAHTGSLDGILTISVGVAGQRMVPGVTVRGLLESADRSLYAAKRQGRNSAVGMPEVVSLVS